MEEKALHFDNNSRFYDAARPGYPEEIYTAVSKHKTFNENSDILEIGAGNGAASVEIYNRWQSKLVLIEPGSNLCKILSGKFGGNKNITIENITFEEYQNTILFDAIFSATAFHWVDAGIKYKKSYELLKDNGLLILYWNSYGIENNELNGKIQKIYTKYGNGIDSGKNVYERQIEKIENRRKEIEGSGYFRITEHKIMKNVIEYDVENYIKLLKTFPDHIKMEQEFFAGVKEAITENGSKIGVRVLTNLEICRAELC
jgi:SAM-dependent methyltransferase